MWDKPSSAWGVIRWVFFLDLPFWPQLTFDLAQNEWNKTQIANKKNPGILVYYMQALRSSLFIFGLHMNHAMRKPLMPYANNKAADEPAHLRSLISVFVVHCYDTYSCYIQNFKTVSTFCSWADRFKSYLVANPRRRDVIHILLILCSENGRNFLCPSPLPYRSVCVAEWLALPTSDHGVAGSNPTGGEILPEPKRSFIVQSLSCSPFHHLEMTEILLKRHKTLTHPSSFALSGATLTSVELFLTKTNREIEICLQ